MRIGIDIDDTLVKTSECFDNIIKKYNLNFNKKLNDKWTDEERNFIFKNYLEEILLKAEIKEGAKEVVNYLSDLGHKLVIITARNNKYCKSIEEKTEKFIRKNDLKISKLYFGQFKKSNLAKELKIDLMIDDNIDVYKNIKEEGIDCILFGNKIKTWYGVLEYIKEKEE